MSSVVATERLSLVNVPNIITAVRTVVSIALATAALAAGDPILLAVAYGVYWVGDMADGFSARLLGQETRIGAVFDIISDRACCALCGATMIVLLPDMLVPLTIFMVQFMVLDTMLSLSFLLFPILSPNYFGTVHADVYRWNWSPPAKAVNTAGAVLLMLFSPSAVWPTCFVLAVVVVKVVSVVAVARRHASGSTTATGVLVPA